MERYPKIYGPYKRDHDTNKLIDKDFTKEDIEYLKDLEWEFTEKIDGTNVRVVWDGDEQKLEFKSRNDAGQLPKPLQKKLEETFTIESMQAISGIRGGNQVCLYGEGYGAGIQKGGKYIKDGVDFILFDVKIGDNWQKREDVATFARLLNVKQVPFLGYGTLDDGIDIVKGTLRSNFGDFEAEGIVARPKVELRNRWGERVITKIKAVDFGEE